MAYGIFPDQGSNQDWQQTLIHYTTRKVLCWLHWPFVTDWRLNALQGECPHPFYIAIEEKEQFCGVCFFFWPHHTACGIFVSSPEQVVEKGQL